jgi:hypothetical protein
LTDYRAMAGLPEDATPDKTDLALAPDVARRGAETTRPTRSDPSVVNVT